uniref:Nuclear envelope pore membrane protein POM 121C-like n=1 Tax=Geotrypetes seraphini TaxID=260995 RepID=A0A6P8P1E3_GEOSA|nr:nuclear envelope pore membrane protein POM 121C-like [Geotrypetes seraphini]XP_033777343.1 nuclear envelope pore membrane protein POM 121C-like [Geotrypetes seraphini]XP_033777344.1 nuclear envelope pore membrane protein POM 121C-like [Geotrypetes seraphini]XP_033777345.1 nuclear envelope pore membrane protein POM 121C-like [Geotrypetes seraphini]XP_033777346.1 nuclear envelope pore membrane protein POM 121C-like [Geotrypetes seraphini]XP_033777348.1 nuclear envelope pore membrane protein P
MTNRYMIPRRRYPIRQPQYSALGSLPLVQWDGYQRKNVLSSRNSCMVHSPVTVKIAPLDVSITRSQLIDQLLSPVPTPSPKIIPDPCARETVLNAIKDCRKRGVEEEDQITAGGQENKRRRHDSSGSGQSAFESLAASGAPAFLIPKPGSLKRGLNPQYAEDPLNKRSRTSSSSSLNSARGILSSVRNAITSSYSSTQGFQQKWKKSVQSSSALSSLSSLPSQTSKKPAKEDELQQSYTSPPVKAAVTESPPGKEIIETPVLKRPNSLRNSSSESGGKRKRKIPLLPSWRGDPLTLPPPPQLGRRVTAEDLDAEKRMAIQRLNKALEEKSSDIPSSSVETTPPGSSFSFIPATTSTSVLALPTSSAGSNPLLESLKKIQNSPTSTEPAGEATQMLPLSSSIFSSAFNAASGTCSLTVVPSSSESVLTSPSVSLVPSSSELPSNTTSLQIPSLLPSETPDAKLPSPKRGILFGMLSGTTPNSAFVTTSPASTAAIPTFKHIFGTPLKVENVVSPLVSLSEACSTPPPSSVTGAASSTTFKPIFGTLTAATNSSTVISPFTFNQTPVTRVGVTPAATSTTCSSIHSGLISAVSTTSSAFGTTTTQRSSSSSIDSSAKPSFTFGLSSVPSTTPATTTGAHSFQFGALSNPTASPATGFGAGFQFNKQPVAATISSTASQATSIFDQTPSSATKAAFSIFGSISTAAATTTSNSQPALTFGSSSSAFSALPFGTSANAPPPYPGITSQPTFSNSIADAQPVGIKPATESLNFSASGTPFSFGMSTVQSAFGNAAQPRFPENNSQSSFTTSNTRPTFGNTTSAFFGTVAPTTAASFGSASTRTTTSSTGGPLFGGTSAFTFGTSNQSGSSSSAFNIGAQNSNVSSATSGFSFGAGQNQPANATATFGIGVQSSSATPVMNRFSFGMGQSRSGSTAVAFGSPVLQSNALSNQNQSAPLSFGTPLATENKLSFGGTSTPTFGQNTSATPVAGGLSFGTSSTPGSGFVTPGPFGSSTPAFSIGLGSKPPGTRQRLQARRQHVRKKQL